MIRGYHDTVRLPQAGTDKVTECVVLLEQPEPGGVGRVYLASSVINPDNCDVPKTGMFHTWKCLLADLLLARGLIEEEQLEPVRHVSIPVE